jgi:DNA-binding ferritin-like protein
MLYYDVNKVSELCCYYVALLRSVYLVHQNGHWLSKGNDFYGNHLMLERIYKTAAEDADLAAEKFLGLFDPSVIDLDMQASLIGKFLKEFASQEPL